MKKIHQAFSEKYPWYGTWHTRRHHATLHWTILFLVLVILILVTINQLLTLQTLHADELQINLRATLRGNSVGAATDHILVAFKNDLAPNLQAQMMRRNHLTEKSFLKEISVHSIGIDIGEKPEAVVERLKTQEDTSIDFAETDTRLSPTFIPNDPDYPNEWHQATIHSPTAWDTAHGEAITIAIIDSGIDSMHADLTGHLVSGWNFYDNTSDTNDVMGHGTAVAGVAAAIGNNALSVVGVAYNANIMPLRATDPNGYAYVSTLANAILYAADHGVKVVNASFAIGGNNTITRAARYLARSGGILVASEGNSGTLSGYQNDDSIINVSATDNADTVTQWSTYGNDVDVSAPGLAILTTARGGGINLYSGTSFSAPLVSGLIALIWSANPALGAKDVTNALFKSALDLGPAGWDDHYGWGRVDAERAVTAALQTTTSVSPAGGPGKKK